MKVKELDLQESDRIDVQDDDPLPDPIESLLNGRTGAAPESQTAIDDIEKEGIARHEDFMPPGFADSDKSGGRFSFGGLEYKSQFGDLHVWKQVIETASSERARYVCLLTDDMKLNWWVQIDSGGKKTIGPRPELVDEILRLTEARTFHTYNSDRLLPSRTNSSIQT